MRAPERTTEEFLVELKNSQSLDTAYRDDLKLFMEHCDLVKFARYEPNAEQIGRALEIVEEFVNKTRSDECKIDVTESKTPEGTE